ncbi:MAG: M20 family metallopeptidase [Gemmatimonadota bacterium]
MPIKAPSDPDLRTAALRRLRQLVELESPSGDESRLRAIAAAMAAELEELGAAVQRVRVDGVGDHLIGRVPGREPDLDPVVVLGHLDTVHAVGTFDPVFRLEGERAYGPGACDMKGGWACMLEALALLDAAGRRPHRPLVVLATCDEETGSDTSRALIEDTARDARAVLVPEPPLPDGGVKTQRKGVAWYRLSVHGRAAHAGLAPEHGVNAITELAHQVLAVTGLADPGAGTSVSVGEAGGGTASNVVPATAWASIDVRFSDPVEGRRVDRALRELRPAVQGARLELEGGVNRWPMERTEGVVELYHRARRLARAMGWTLGEGMAGGASDGSLTAALGVPTLDGIGPAGGGAHAPDEHVRVADLARRVRLYARLLEEL